MKKLHKVLMGLTAIVMAFSMTAMTACVDGEGGTNGGNNGGNNIGNNGGNEGGNQGGNQGGNNEGGNQGGNSTVTKTDAQKTIEAFQTQSFKAIGITANSDLKDNGVSYACDDKGVMLAGATKEEMAYTQVSTVSEKINFVNFAMDMNEHSVSQMLDKDGKPVAGAKEESYNYDFMREGYSFYTTSEKAITDFSKATLRASQGDMPEQLDAIFAQMPEDGVPAGLLAPVTAVLNLADIYGGATFADKKLTVNFNKVAYNLYSEVLKVIEDLNDKTTVGDVIAAAPVKNLIESLTYGVDTKEVYDQVLEMLKSAPAVTEGEAGSSSAMINSILNALPQPTEGEGVYDYLVRLLGSGELKMLFAQMTGAEMKKPVSELTFAEIAPLFGMTQAPAMEEIKEMVKGMLDSYATVTEDKVTVTMSEYTTLEISATQLAFNVGDDYTVSSISVSTEVAMSYEDTSYNGSEYVKYEGVQNYEITAEIEIAKNEYTLTDISKAQVEERKYELKDGIYYSYNTILEVLKISEEEAGPKAYTNVYLGVTLENGTIKSVDAYTCETEPEDSTPELIKDCVFTGDTLTFTIEGVQGQVTCRVDIDERQYSDGYAYIEVECSVGEALPVKGEGYFYDVYDNLGRVYVDAEETTTTTTVAEILAQAK